MLLSFNDQTYLLSSVEFLDAIFQTYIKQTIDNQNKQKLRLFNNNATENEESKPCNCKKKDECPLDGNCLQAAVIYQAKVTRTDNNTHETYVGLTENDFKTCYRNHTASFRNIIIREPHRCTLNKRNKLVSGCRHRKKSLQRSNWAALGEPLCKFQGYLKWRLLYIHLVLDSQWVRQLTKQLCQDATFSPVLTFQPNHSFIPALSNDIEHSMQTSRFPVYYSYINNYLYIYVYIYIHIFLFFFIFKRKKGCNYM